MGEIQPGGKHSREKHHSKGCTGCRVLGEGQASGGLHGPLPALQVDACASPGLVIRGKRCLILSFLKGPLPSAGGQPCAPRALTPTLRLDSRLWAEHLLCGVLGAFHLPLRQDRGWAAPLLPLAALVPGGPRVAGSGCRLRREPLTLEETQAHCEVGAGSGASWEDLLSLQPSPRLPQNWSRLRPAGQGAAIPADCSPPNPLQPQEPPATGRAVGTGREDRTEELLDPWPSPPAAAASLASRLVEGCPGGGRRGRGSGDSLAATPPPRARASGQSPGTDRDPGLLFLPPPRDGCPRGGAGPSPGPPVTPRPVWPLPEGGPGRRSPCSGGICAWWSCCFREILEAVFGREDPRAPQWAPSLRGAGGRIRGRWSREGGAPPKPLGGRALRVSVPTPPSV